MKREKIFSILSALSSKMSAKTKAKSSKSKESTVPGKRKRTSNGKLEKDDDEFVSSYFAPETGIGVEGKLGRTFYDQDTIQLAKDLLGKVLCRKLSDTGEILKGTIVETEAYPGEGDAASHSFKGVPTPSSMAMFMDPGTAYVYFTYGMYYCFNISSKDNGGACLLRAVEVHEDYEVMHSLRRPKKKKADETVSSKQATATASKPEKKLKPHELANGPAKLCLAFNITRDMCDKVDMTVSDDLWLENNQDENYRTSNFEMSVSKRVGIDSTPPVARNQLYRFFIKDNASVSKAKFKDDKVVQPKRSSSRSRKK